MTTLAGFRVAEAAAPHKFVLEGAHRFARYRLTFRLDPVGPGSCHVRAETDADFPGLRGVVYRALVLGSGGHVLVVKRMLRRIKRLAETGERRVA